MKYFFDDIENDRKLKEILDSWIFPPTPFRHRCGVKGLGCDCIHFVMKVLEEAGVVSWRKDLIPDYPKDWHLHNTREMLAEGLIRELHVEKVSLDDLKNGDIILSHYGKASSHSAIYYDEHVYQALNETGVKRISFSDRVFRRQMKFAYRVLL